MSLHPHRPSLRVEKAEAVTRVALVTEDLEEANLQALGEQLLALADGLAPGRLELDLGDARYLTSTALGKFVSLNRRVRERGSHLVLANVTSLVHEIFEVTHLHRIFDIRRGPDDGPFDTATPLLAS